MLLIAIILQLNSVLIASLYNDQQLQDFAVCDQIADCKIVINCSFIKKKKKKDRNSFRTI